MGRENIAKEVDKDRRVIAKEVDDKRMKEEEAAQQQKKAAAAEQAQRSTGPVDRTCTVLELGRPPDRPTRLTVSTQLSVGDPVDRCKRSVDRPVDRQAGRAALCRFGNLLYLSVVVGF